jgi:OPT family oligopeptide transporter
LHHSRQQPDAHNNSRRRTGDIPLSSLRSPPTRHDSREHPDEDEELDPESTSALLRRHLQDDSDDDEVADTNSPFINPLRKLAGLMSKAPLLLRSSPGFGTGSYGAAPIGASTENSDEEDADDVRRRDKRRTKMSGLRNTVSTGTLDSSQSGASKRRRRSHSTKGDDPEDMAEDIGLEGRYSAGGIPIPNSAGPDGQDDSETQEEDSEEVIDDSSLNDEDPPDNSPYPQVRASVSAIDNTSLSINTPRMWILSLLFAILGSSTNLFFSLRYPSVSITPVIALLLVHPLGLLWDRILKRRDDPQDEFIDGMRSRRASNETDEHNDRRPLAKPAGTARRLRLWLSQGRWNEKEHSCVYISSNVSFGFAFATDVIVEQTQFYNQKVSITYQLLLILSTQILGYTFAGLTRRFLVRPGGMIWPGTLMSAAMFTTLHKEENTIANGWKVTRWKFFFTVWICAFFFYFLPGLLFPALSYFSVITWFFPKNVVVANLFGVASGLGLFPVTFDWAQIAYIGSPLLTPFWAAMNVVGGLVIVMWIIAPIAYYKNIFFSSYMPILSSAVFDNTGHVYDVSKILTKDFLFDKEAYHKYSRVYLPITYVLSYGLQFAALASLLTHTACWHGSDIWRQWKASLKEVEGESKGTYKVLPTNGEASGTNGYPRLTRSDSNMDNIISQEDVHNRLMKRYKDAPLSWYLLTFVSMTAVGIFVCE